MKIDTFKVEKWMDDYENDAVYNLAETCIDSLTIGELLTLCGEDPAAWLSALRDVRMTYSHIFGSPALLEGICALYQDLRPEQILPTHGGIGANNLVITTLIAPEDNMVSVLPTYQQHYSIPASLGAEVRLLRLRRENAWLPDLDELRRLVDRNTKLITINNPNNPTGSWIPEEMLREIVRIAEDAGAYLLSDEVYRGISEDGSYMPSVVDLCGRGISVGSMSKVFSLAGLRFGWIAAKDPALLEALRERRDYDTISCGVLDDTLAALALRHRDAIFARNRAILLKNRRILDEWVRKTPEVDYVRPAAGTTALVYYHKDIPSRALCLRLLREKGVLFTPGECFEMEGAVRIGYAFDADVLSRGLDLFAELLREL